MKRWLRRSFFNSAIVPLLFIELVFLGIFVGSSLIVYWQNVEAQRAMAADRLNGISQREARIIAAEFSAVAQNTDLLARAAARAMTSDFTPTAAERNRFAFAADGTFYSRYDNGGAAGFLSALKPAQPGEIELAYRLGQLDPFMKDLQETHPLVVSTYVNTSFNYNHIYPYFDVLKQYPRKLDIKDYNFYYEADERHNPGRKAVWTDVYADPAGHGWMLSSIAPVWRDGKLQAVVGQDVTIDALVNRLRRLNITWSGFAMLVDNKGRIIAMPPQAERQLGLRELTDYTYDQTVKQDTFKPSSFDLNLRPETRLLARTMRENVKGRLNLDLNGPVMAGFSRIPGVNWTLVVVAKDANVFRLANRIRSRQQLVGWIMAAMLAIFYAVFFVYLSGRATRMGQRISQALAVLAEKFGQIGQGSFRQEIKPTGLAEIDELGDRLVSTGNQLGDAYDTILEQERALSTALVKQRQASEEQSRFLRVMSHEIRTPLAIIDSSAQILARKADQATPADLTDRAGRIQRAVERIARLLESLGQTIEREREARKQLGQESERLHSLVADIAAEVIPAERLVLELPGTEVLIAEAAPVALALRALLDNALRYSMPGEPIRVTLETAGGDAIIKVADGGPGIPAGDLDRVGERFFRGSNAQTIAGAGVGIYVARKVLESAGGSLDIVSGPEGTVAIQKLPLAPENREAA